MPLASINPATGETIKTFEELTDSEIENKLARAEETFTIIGAPASPSAPR